MSCCLGLFIEDYGAPLSSGGSSESQQIHREIAHQQAELRDCVIGRLQTAAGLVPYPKLVRPEDIRSRTVDAALYRSPIAVLIEQFRASMVSSSASSSPGDFAAGISDRRLRGIFQVVFNELRTSLCDVQGDGRMLDIGTRSFHDGGGVATLGNAVALLRYGSEGVEELVASAKEAQSLDLGSLLRLLLFASYLANHVVLTSIHTQSEEDAFSIFDALNTTGTPLTALETCKPLVTDFERRHGPGFRESESGIRWSAMEEALTAAYPKPEDQAAFVQKVVIAFGCISTEQSWVGTWLNSVDTCENDFALQRRRASMQLGDSSRLSTTSCSSTSHVGRRRTHPV